MRFGVYLPNEGDFADIRVLTGLAREAEEAGWDGFFIWDALLPIYEHSDDVRHGLGDSGHIADAFVALTAIAAHTERLRFGAMVSAVPRLRPEVLARQAVSLDHFSGGRLTLGIGLGNPDTQFTAFGWESDVRVRAAMVDEFLDVLVQLWSGRGGSPGSALRRPRRVDVAGAAPAPQDPHLDRRRLPPPGPPAPRGALGRLRPRQRLMA